MAVHWTTFGDWSTGPVVTTTLLLVLCLTLPVYAEQSSATGEAIPAAADSPSPPSGLQSPPRRADQLVDRARDDGWSADELFEYLGLDEPQQCLDFTERAHLRERHARWREAVQLLDRIDPDALDAWLLGERPPPDIAADETRRQLNCLYRGMFDAVGGDYYDIQLFRDLHGQLDGRFRTTDAAIGAVDRSPWLFDHIVQVLTRSVYRNIYSQASIWHRKLIFSGRSFNRISRQTAGRCGLGGARLWNPSSDHHRHCWHNILSATEREREVLRASAGPGLSRHHWGTDVDILSLNPANFTKRGPLHDDWRWLDAHALDYGFFQPYGPGGDHGDGYAHMEERWHWSYYPIAQALWDFVLHHQQRFEQALFERWDSFEARWSSAHGPYFDHLRDHWRDYLFHIDLPAVDAHRSVNHHDRITPDSPPLP